MLEKVPTNEEMIILIGQPLFDVWTKLTDFIESKYDMDRLWNNGGKKWTYEYKYRRGGKSLCALYAKENVFGFMIIFGKAEREKVEAIRSDLSPETQRIYDEATTYHDGKWVIFELTDTSLFSDMEKLLMIKRKPNKK
ncbi:DUF3788 domain-containing protein [Sporomusa sphaeroides]|uniref:DUF3788 domain-containing protein n=1 Tax=Sporomusa sphaeroides DSM 2875 TaxID=1337886 RepID=A0ABM9W5Z1_9FIRM|nr:DUF3788 domain-containing protein [Sporomusa sphaeroides]OLS56038.1 hypothetical protein SPSPH_24250 [Sporomusa sphaeroides DSM 2875]CVK20249.1 hypothetical protein SSPH_02916 [Sporomusa sphaeroides DSM 2875]